MYLLDTNAASDISKGRSTSAREALQLALMSSTVALSVVSLAEIRFGVRNKPGAHAYRKAFEALCTYVKILPWDESCAEAYADLRLAMKARNRSLESMDLLIAAHARAANAILVTRDKAFEHLSGLVETANWAVDASGSKYRVRD